MNVKPSVRGLELVALALAVFLIVALALQNDALGGENDRIRDLAFSAHPGMYVPILNARDIHGQEIQVGSPPTGRFQALFFLRTDCEFSLASLPEWDRVQRRLVALGHDAVGISFDSLATSQEFAGEQGLGFPLVPLPDRRVAGVFRVSGVPTTLVIDDQGRVVYSRSGSFTGAASDSLFASIQSAVGGGVIP